jgi:hypothetical protein
MGSLRSLKKKRKEQEKEVFVLSSPERLKYYVCPPSPVEIEDAKQLIRRKEISLRWSGFRAILAVLGMISPFFFFCYYLSLMNSLTLRYLDLAMYTIATLATSFFSYLWLRFEAKKSDKIIKRILHEIYFYRDTYGITIRREKINFWENFY